MNEIAVLKDENPLLSLRGPDGRWSARDVQKSGHVHTTWRKFEDAVKRGRDVIASQLGEAAAQGSFVPMVKSSPQPNGGFREVQDYFLDEWGLLATLQKSDIPQIDLWFTAAAIQALGLSGRVVVKREEKPVTRRMGGYTEYQIAVLAALDVKQIGPDGIVFGDKAAAAGKAFLAGRGAQAKARLAAKEERARLALPAPPAPRRPLPWGMYATLADKRAFFDNGYGDWDHVAEFAARERNNGDRWIDAYDDMKTVVGRYIAVTRARGSDEITHPTWTQAKAALDYVDKERPKAT